MNGKSILRLIAVIGLAKLAFGAHHHRMSSGSRGRNQWHDRIAELHRELHRSDAEAASTLAPDVELDEGGPA